jgi:hypothetical protein
MGAVVTVAFVVPVAAGTLPNARYALPSVAIACAFAGVAIGGWAVLLRSASLRLSAAVAALGVVALAVTAPRQAGRFSDTRRIVQRVAETRSVAEALARGPLPCGPLVVPTADSPPWRPSGRDVDRPAIVDQSKGAVSRGTFLTGNARAVEFVVTLPGRDRDLDLPQPPSGAREVDSDRGWRLLSACGRPD